MEDIDALVQNQCWDHLMPNDTSSGTDAFYVDIRRCDYEAELNKQFGGYTARYRKPQLIQKKDEWPPILSSGLKGAMREDSFEITHSSHYKQLEIQMINGYLTNDADRIVHMHRQHSGHLGSLYILSEQYRISDINAAHDLVERGLFVIQRSHRGRLSYHIENNRIVHLLLAKHLQYLNRKGSWRSAFEIGELMVQPSVEQRMNKNSSTRGRVRHILE